MDDLEHSVRRTRSALVKNSDGVYRYKCKDLGSVQTKPRFSQTRVTDPIGCLKNLVKPTRLGLGSMGLQRSPSQRLRKPLTRKSGLSGAKGKRSGVTYTAVVSFSGAAAPRS